MTQIPKPLVGIGKKKIIFVGVPKTGTKFVNATVVGDRPNEDHWVYRGHCFFADLDSWYGKGTKYGFTKSNINIKSDIIFDGDVEMGSRDDFIVVATIRNPFSHLYSLWNYGWSGGRHQLQSCFSDG